MERLFVEMTEVPSGRKFAVNADHVVGLGPAPASVAAEGEQAPQTWILLSNDEDDDPILVAEGYGEVLRMLRGGS